MTTPADPFADLLREGLPDELPIPPEVSQRILGLIAGQADSPTHSLGRDVVPIVRSPRRWVPVLAAACVVLVLATGGQVARIALTGVPASDTAVGAAPEMAAPGAYPTVETRYTRSGRNYSKATLATQLGEVLLADSQDGAGSSLVGSDAIDPTCIPELAGPAGGTPMLVDSGQFQGRPALVIAFAPTGDPPASDIWVVDPSCSGADANVRYFARSLFN